MKKLTEVFEAEPYDDGQTVTIYKTAPEVDTEKDTTEDVDFAAARQNIYDILEVSKEAMQGIARVSREKEDARSYEVFAKVIETVSKVNKDLMTLSKDRHEAKAAKKGIPAGQQAPSIGTQNVTFVGTSSDLNRMLAEKLAEASTPT
jgi:hypothetical protein